MCPPNSSPLSRVQSAPENLLRYLAVSFLVQFLANYVSTHFDVIVISIVGHLKTLQGNPFICGVIITGSLILLIRTSGDGLPRKRRGFRLVFEFFF